MRKSLLIFLAGCAVGAAPPSYVLYANAQNQKTERESERLENERFEQMRLERETQKRGEPMNGP